MTAMDISCRIRHGSYATVASTVARQTLWPAGDRKRKCNPRTVIWRRPEAAMMTLDNRTADRQSDSHTFILGRVEGFEKPVCRLRLETDSSIAHAEAHAIIVIWFSPNQ